MVRPQSEQRCSVIGCIRITPRSSSSPSMPVIAWQKLSSSGSMNTSWPILASANAAAIWRR